MDTRSLEPREIGERQPAVAHAVAITTARPTTGSSSRSSTRNVPSSGLSAIASPGTVIAAPNFRAWIVARSASSAPEIPAGSRGSSRSWRRSRPGHRSRAPRARRSIALRRAVHGGRQPGWTAADDDQIADRVRDGWGPQPQRAGELRVARVAQHASAAEEDDRALLRPEPEPAQDLLRAGSDSRSTQWCGRRLRTAKSRSRRVSGE